MKKILLLAAFFLAIGSYGGHIASANAQTMTSTVATSSDAMIATATLEQQLAVAKATLVSLEQQAGQVPAGDNGTSSMMTVTITPTPAAPSMVVPPSTTGALSAAEVNSFESTLSTLAATLGQLNGTLSSNSALTSVQQQAVQSTLNGMASTLTAMTNTIDSDMAMNSNSVAPQNNSVAAASPAQNSAEADNTPSVTVTPTTPATAPATTPTVTAEVTPSTPTDQANQAPQTAQASSFWSFAKDHWPTVAIIILIIAILVILFWPEKEVVTTISTQSRQTNSQSTTTTPHSAPSSNNVASASPVSTVVGASTQKVDTTTETTVVRPTSH